MSNKKSQPKGKPSTKGACPIERMSYPTYAYLRTLLEDQIEKLKNESRIALKYISGISAMNNAHKIYTEQYLEFQKMLDELHVAAAATYKDHPLKEMREFWGLKD